MSKFAFNRRAGIFLLCVTLFAIGVGGGSSSVAAYTVSQTTGAVNAINSCGYAVSDTGYCAESFTTVGSGSIDAATFTLSNDGANTLTYHLEIRADNSGVPAATNLGSSDSIAQGSFPTTSGANACNTGATTFTFSTPVALSASTVYWVVISSGGSYDLAGLRMCGSTALGVTGQQAESSTANLTTWTSGGTKVANFSFDIQTSSTAPPITWNFSTTTTLIDDPDSQLFHMFVLFFMGMTFIIWLMRK